MPMTYTFAELFDGGTTVEVRIAKLKPKDGKFLTKVAAAPRSDLTGRLSDGVVALSSRRVSWQGSLHVG